MSTTAEAAYLGIAAGEQLPFLCVLAFMMGMGKGGVPGSSTSSVALNSLYAPDIEGGLNLAAALQVPVTFASDIAVVFNYAAHAQWPVIFRLLPPTAVGLGLGMQLLGQIGKARTKKL